MSYSISTALKEGICMLHSVEDPSFETELLLSHVLTISRSILRAYPEKILTLESENKFRDLLNRRLAGEPIAYLLGEKEFWSLPLIVNKNTLIPRPETEQLVQLILEKYSEYTIKTVADLGTGSGAIALALASVRPTWKIVATDLSSNALQIAIKNAANLHLKNITFLQGDWCEALPSQSRYHIIVSNPPYISEKDPHLGIGDLRFEPKNALIAGEEGLSALKIIISRAKYYLISEGLLVLEHGYDQGKIVRQLLQQAGYKNVVTHKDLSGIERVTEAVS